MITPDFAPRFLTVTVLERIDKLLAAALNISRTTAQELITNGMVEVDERLVVRKANFVAPLGAKIKVVYEPPKPLTAEPQAMDLSIVYEDEDLLVINKPSGLVVHPAPGHRDNTLVNGLVHHFANLSSLNGQLRPGIVHRIDKDTSGLLLVAKHDGAHQVLSEALQRHDIKRIYYALVEGVIARPVLHINLPIGRDKLHRKQMAVTADHAKQAITHVRVLKTSATKNQTLVQCELETGRTHQIRVHLAYIKHPVVGDPLYGHKIDDYNQRLHAAELIFNHPRTGKVIHIKAPLPDWAEHFVE